MNYFSFLRKHNYFCDKILFRYNFCFKIRYLLKAGIGAGSGYCRETQHQVILCVEISVISDSERLSWPWHQATDPLCPATKDALNCELVLIQNPPLLPLAFLPHTYAHTHMCTLTH